MRLSAAGQAITVISLAVFLGLMALLCSMIFGGCEFDGGPPEAQPTIRDHCILLASSDAGDFDVNVFNRCAYGYAIPASTPDGGTND